MAPPDWKSIAPRRFFLNTSLLSRQRALGDLCHGKTPALYAAVPLARQPSRRNRRGFFTRSFAGMTKYRWRVIAFLCAESSAAPPLFVRCIQFLHTLAGGRSGAGRERRSLICPTTAGRERSKLSSVKPSREPLKMDASTIISRASAPPSAGRESARPCLAGDETGPALFGWRGGKEWVPGLERRRLRRSPRFHGEVVAPCRRNERAPGRCAPGVAGVESTRRRLYIVRDPVCIGGLTAVTGAGRTRRSSAPRPIRYATRISLQETRYGRNFRR